MPAQLLEDRSEAQSQPLNSVSGSSRKSRLADARGLQIRSFTEHPLCVHGASGSESGPPPRGTGSTLPAPSPAPRRGQKVAGTGPLAAAVGRWRVRAHWKMHTRFGPSALGHLGGLRVPSRDLAVFSDGKGEALPFAALQSFGVLESGQVLGASKARGPELGETCVTLKSVQHKALRMLLQRGRH